MRPIKRSLQGNAKSSAQPPDTDALMEQLEGTPQLMDAFTKKFVEQYGEQIMVQLARKMLKILNA